MLELFERLGKLSYLQVLIGNSFALTMLLGNIASVIVFFYNKSNFEVPELWLETIATKCPDLKPGEQDPIL